MTARFMLGLALALPVAIWAADDIKPLDLKTGLWEVTTTTEITGLPAMPAMPQIDPATLEKMPPAQRKQLEAMMAGRGAAGSPKTSTSKVCITRESLNRAKMFESSDKNCNNQILSSDGTKLQMHIQCVDEKTKMTTAGDLTFERLDSEHVKGSMLMKNVGNDRAIDFKLTYSNKFVNSDCGEVKPAGQK